MLTRTHHSKISPVQHVTQSLSSVPLDNPLSSAKSCEIIHVLCQLLNRIFQRDIPPVHYVDTIRHGVCDVLLHETPKTCK